MSCGKKKVSKIVIQPEKKKILTLVAKNGDIRQSVAEENTIFANRLQEKGHKIYQSLENI